MVTKTPEAWAAELDFAGMERRHGLPSGILTNLVRQESGGNSSISGPMTRYGARAQGLCQFMPATARERGINPLDPKSSAEGAAKYLEDLMDMFGGDVNKAIAAYNWGQGNVRKHGANWRAAMPPETKNYLRVVGRGIGPSFAQRQETGEVIPQEEQDIEEMRRRARLTEAGIPEDVTQNMSLQGILGSLFFALIASFLTKKMDAQEQQAAPVVPPVTLTPPLIPSTDVNLPTGAPRTPAVARQTAASRSPAHA